MIAFLKSIDRKIWNVVVTGWSPPQVTENNRVVNPKLENDWRSGRR